MPIFLYDCLIYINMPTLNWIGKEAVVNHDKEVPFILLKKVKAHSVGDNSQNLIIKGDNLEGLKALMPYYVGKVKCIYIDPPYNTGNENWVYNDKVNSPKIKKWLGKVVGGEAQDLCRHDKWLCMMYPRLKLLRELLSDDSVIFVSIGEDELYRLKMLMDEIFYEDNFVGNIIRITGSTRNMAVNLDIRHEYLLFYSKDKTKMLLNKIKRKENNQFDNPDKDIKGDWSTQDLTVRTGGHSYKIPSLDGSKNFKKNWAKREDELKSLMDGNPNQSFLEIYKNNMKEVYHNGKKWYVVGKVVFKGKDKVPNFKKYLTKVERQVMNTFWSDIESQKYANQILIELMNKKVFDNPKPISLIKKIIEVSTSSTDIVLDSFAGSGTTGHAVMDLNKKDGGRRKFILIEMEDDIAKKVTAERIKRAIKKYDYKEGFEYCELDKPLFNENGQIEETCDFNQFATYIYFTETQTNIDKKKIEKNFIGDYNNTEYYLIYKEKYKNVLNKSFLSKVKKNKNKKIIYADKCLVDEDVLKKHNIIFKQIPYEVKVY